MGRIHNSLRAARRSAQLTQEALALAAGVSRQAYSAIESGEAVPSTEVALRLGRALGVNVEQLFALPDDARPTVVADLVGDLGPGGTQQRVRLTRVGGRLLARTLTGEAGVLHILPGADGVTRAETLGTGQTTVELLGDIRAADRALVMLGCDPSAALLARSLHERNVELIWNEAGSRAALEGLARGEAHIAGCHLLDPETDVYNLPWIRQIVPFPCTVVSFAVWQQGLIVGSGNPLKIGGVGDLGRSEVRFVNRDPGTGARMLLDKELHRVGLASGNVRGYECRVPGHLAVAETIRVGFADAGIGIRAAAQAAALDFIPLDEEQYDLVIPNHFLDLESVGALVDLLHRPVLRHQVEALGGYDVAGMGTSTTIRA